jgi:hypothetical protein
VKYITTAIILFISFSCSPKAKLEDKVQTVEFHYIPWACECANWATSSDIDKYENQGNDELADHSVFIEPADEALTLPDTLGYIGDIVLLTGQYYVEKGFPKNFSTEQPVDKAKVFKYTAYKIIKSNYREAVNAMIE